MAGHKIERGIPIPIPSPAGRKATYPLGEMAVGDSFLVPHEERRKAAHAAWYFGKCSGRRFTVRVVEDGVRIWRIEDRADPKLKDAAE